jgi:dienelactone hydrolase
VVPNQTAAATGGQPTAPTTGNTYQWTITGGRITSSSTQPVIEFVADAAGSVTLNVVVTSGGVAQSASIQVTVLSATMAGSIKSDATVATGATNLTASVPDAVNGDRTFRWTITGGTIASGQGTNAITYRAGAAGLLELNCAVTLEKIITVNLRSYVVVRGSGAPTTLTVTNGQGSGTYPAGSKIDVFANPPAAGQVFDKWTGDIAALGTGTLIASVPHGVITMPSTATAITATYKAASTWTPTVVTNFNPVTQNGANNTTSTVSTTLSYYIPAAAQGLVVLLHDSPGALASWFSNPEQSLLTRELVAAGFGVAALNSVNRTTGVWAAQATLANNLDAGNIAAALDRFAKDGTYAATKPVFLLGFSAGADAAARYAEMLASATPARPIKGTVLYCATGGATLAVTSKVPQFFALAANDEVLGAAGLTTARDNAQYLAGRGVASALTSINPAPVYSGRFSSLAITAPSFSAADATAVWNAVKAAGFLDDNNYVKDPPSLDAVRTALPAAYQARAADVLAQLSVAAATQEFFSEANSRVIAFLAARASGTPGPTPGRLVNLSTRTKISFVGDSFTLGFNISGAAKATLLIRGIGPALAKFGLATALPAPRLEVNKGSTIIATNDGWDKGGNATQIANAAASVGAFPLGAGDGDTAVLLTLDPGTYTATIRGFNGAVGDVLAEVYDVSKNGTRLTNLSTLASISEAGGFINPGIVIEGNNPRTLVARAVAPGLATFGLPTEALLGDPSITVLNSTGATVATNNNWNQAAAGGVSQAGTLAAVFPAVGAFNLTPGSDAALVSALAPGSFTLRAAAQANATGGTGAAAGGTTTTVNQTGMVLVEIYEVP